VGVIDAIESWSIGSGVQAQNWSCSSTPIKAPFIVPSIAP